MRRRGGRGRWSGRARARDRRRRRATRWSVTSPPGRSRSGLGVRSGDRRSSPPTTKPPRRRPRPRGRSSTTTTTEAGADHDDDGELAPIITTRSKPAVDARPPPSTTGERRPAGAEHADAHEHRAERHHRDDDGRAVPADGRLRPPAHRRSGARRVGPHAGPHVHDRRLRSSTAACTTRTTAAYHDSQFPTITDRRCSTAGSCSRRCAVTVDPRRTSTNGAYWVPCPDCARPGSPTRTRPTRAMPVAVTDSPVLEVRPDRERARTTPKRCTSSARGSATRSSNTRFVQEGPMNGTQHRRDQVHRSATATFTQRVLRLRRNGRRRVPHRVLRGHRRSDRRMPCRTRVSGYEFPTCGATATATWCRRLTGCVDFDRGRPAGSRYRVRHGHERRRTRAAAPGWAREARVPGPGGASLGSPRRLR